MDEPLKAADWAYRGYSCQVYRKHTERDYPLTDCERIVGMVDGNIVGMYSDDPLKYNIEEMIDACEQWVDTRMSGWLQ